MLNGVYMYKIQYHLNDEEKLLLSKCFSDLENSKKYIFEFGQKFLKPLKTSREIQEKTYAILEFFLVNKSNYIENLLIPEQYMVNKDESISNINYTFRDFLAWSVFYPSEVDRYFSIKGKSISLLENPAQRIVDKDKYRMGKKKEDGILIDIRMKKDSDTILDGGFTLLHKDNLLNITVACFIDKYFLDEKVINSKVKEVEPEEVKVVKKTKKAKKA